MKLPAPSQTRVPPQRPGRTSATRQPGAVFTSLMIVSTALYGDMLKRILPPTTALAAIYGIVALILARMLITGRRDPAQRIPTISTLAGLLIGVYLLQLGTNFEVDLLPAAMMAIYVCIPLFFIYLIPRAYRGFDLYALARYTALLALPVHAVGLVQQFVDGQFLVSTVYSEMGGVIARNFLDGDSHFNRFPSLFASADRYAGVSAAQFLLSFVLVGAHGTRSKGLSTLIALSFVGAIIGLLIAGARSRILIVGLAVAFAGVSLLLGVGRAQISARVKLLAIRGVLALATVLAGLLTIEDVRNRILDLPILTMMSQTAESGDAGKRFNEGLEVNAVPDDVTFFGKGLGTSADGRPGEFAIRAMWIEGGFFWTIIMLVLFGTIQISLVRVGLRSMLSGDALRCLFMAAAALYWLFGIMAGLSSTFELSLALLLFPMIAVAAIPPTSGRQARVPPQVFAVPRA